MAEIKSFNGVRYAQSEISKLICPPYDVISAQEKTNLQKAIKEVVKELKEKE